MNYIQPFDENNAIVFMATERYILGMETTKTHSTVNWFDQTNTLAALQSSSNCGKLLFLDFFAPNCKGCEKLEKITYRDPRICALLNETFVPLLYNARQPDDNFDLLNGKSIYAFSPVLIIKSSDGIELHRVTGYLPPDDMLIYLNLGLALDALYHRSWPHAYDLLDQAVAKYPSAKNVPEALWWRGVAAFRKSGGDLSALADAWSVLRSEFPFSQWADRADILKIHCEC